MDPKTSIPRQLDEFFYNENEQTMWHNRIESYYQSSALPGKKLMEIIIQLPVFPKHYSEKSPFPAILAKSSGSTAKRMIQNEYHPALYLCSFSINMRLFSHAELFLHFLKGFTHKRQFLLAFPLPLMMGLILVIHRACWKSLARQKIKACFFLVEKKQKNILPLSNKFKTRMYIIGCHNYIHRHAWLLSPWTSWKLWDKGIESIKNITGQEPEYIRPLGEDAIWFYT